MCVSFSLIYSNFNSRKLDYFYFYAPKCNLADSKGKLVKKVDIVFFTVHHLRFVIEKKLGADLYPAQFM